MDWVGAFSASVRENRGGRWSAGKEKRKRVAGEPGDREDLSGG